MEELPKKKLIAVHKIDGGGIIPEYEVDFSKPEVYFPYKPENSPMSHMDWAHFAMCFGIAHAWNSCFWEWLKERGYMTWGAGGMLPACFGRVGEDAKKLVFGNRRADERGVFHIEHEEWERVTEVIIDFAKSRPLEDFGLFCVWIKEAGMDPKYAPAIVKEFMDD